MKKLLLSLFVLMLGLSGCSSSNSSGGSKEGDVESISIAVEGKYVDWVTPHAEAYTEDTGVKVEIREVDSWYSVVESLAQTIPSGQAPDLVPMSYDNFSSTVEAGLIVPLDSSGFDKAYGEKALETISYKEKAYLYPLQMESVVMFYDKSKVTDEEIAKLDAQDFKTIIDFNEKSGFTYPLMQGYYFIPLIGEEVFDDGEAPTKLNITDKIWVDGATNIQKLAKNYPTTLKDTTQDALFSQNMFKEKEVAAALDGPWSYSVYKEAYGENLGLTALKGLTPFTGLVGYASTNTGDEAKMKAAQDFAKYLTQDCMDDFYSNSGFIPVATSAREKLDKSDTYIFAQIDGFENSIPMIKSPIGNEVWAPLQNAMVNIVNGDDVEAELEKASEEIKAIATKYNLTIE